MEKFDELIFRLRSQAKKEYIPVVRDKTIMQVAEILREENYHQILEIGTAIGYSGILMLAAAKGAFLTTIEKDWVRYGQAVENFKALSFDKKADLILGDAYEEISKLSVQNKKFDFIFLDGPKGQYYRYLPLLKGLLLPGGSIFADNVLLGGLINNQKEITHKNRSMVVNMKKFLLNITSDPSFSTKFYDIDDGFIVSKLKNSTE